MNFLLSFDLKTNAPTVLKLNITPSIVEIATAALKCMPILSNKAYRLYPKMVFIKPTTINLNI